MHSAPPHWPNSKFRDVPRSARGPLSTGYFRLRLGSLGGAGQRALTGNYVYIRRRITLDPQITLISEEFQPSLRGAMPGPISVLQFRERRHSREMSVATRPSTFGEGGSRHSSSPTAAISKLLTDLGAHPLQTPGACKHYVVEPGPKTRVIRTLRAPHDRLIQRHATRHVPENPGLAHFAKFAGQMRC